jgi:hypothetical protein
MTFGDTVSKRWRLYDGCSKASVVLPVNCDTYRIQKCLQTNVLFHCNYVGIVLYGCYAMYKRSWELGWIESVKDNRG